MSLVSLRDYCFIVNPAAHGGRAGRRWPKLKAQLDTAGIAYSYYLSDHPGHGSDLTRAALQAGYRNFVAVGGDGTANEVLNGLLPRTGSIDMPLSLGTIPWGTGNDWARNYQLPSSTDGCIKLLRDGFTSAQDIGEICYTDAAGKDCVHYFLNSAGTGFDSYLLERMGSHHSNRTAYFRYVLKCLRSFQALTLKLDPGGESMTSKALILEICLGQYAGGGMRFAPAALADDGLLDVLLIGDMPLWQILFSLIYLYNGKINRHPAARHWQSRSVSVAAESEPGFHCDGELVGQLPVKIQLLPKALNIVCAQAGRAARVSPTGLT